MYYLVPVNNSGVLDIDYTDLIEGHHYSANQAMVHLVDSAIVRSSWTQQTQAQWDTYVNPFSKQQADKLDELKLGYASAFTTFQSSALGSVHTYPIDAEAEYNFRKWTQLLTLNSNISTVQFKTIENGMTDHTRSQFIQVLTDLASFEVTQAKKFEAKDNQRTACTETNNQLSSIVWNDTTAPSTPTGLTATAGTGQAMLSWTVNIEIDVQIGGSYNVYKSGVKLANVTTNSYTATGLTSGTAVNFTVSAVDSDGNESSQSALVTVTPN